MKACSTVRVCLGDRTFNVEFKEVQKKKCLDICALNLMLSYGTSLLPNCGRQQYGAPLRSWRFELLRVSAVRASRLHSRDRVKYKTNYGV
eukprot:119518-Pleurochrysis_carterae.AAC.1